MRRVNTIWSPAIGTINLADIWIHQSIEQELHNMFPQYFFYTIPCKDYLNRFRRVTKKSQFVFVGGTNLLASRMHFPHSKQWKLRWRNTLFIKELILVGVGWNRYEGLADSYTRFLLKKLLSKRFVHSVRDCYTEAKLRAIGITNVINTGCPTMWPFTSEFLAEIPTSKAKHAVITLCRVADAERWIDKRMLEIVTDHYEQVFLWPQAEPDRDYLQTLISETAQKGRIQIINPHLSAYTELLNSDLSIDSIGSRLHGGIIALNTNAERLSRVSIIAP